MTMEPFLNYMERYKPGYRSRIRGVSEQEIALMEELYQRPLPESYKEFLRVMGADSGGFQMVGDADSSYDEVMECAQDRLEDPEWSPSLREYVIVALGFFLGDHVALHDALDGEPPVVGVDLNPYMVFSTSLVNLMMNTAHTQHGMREFAHHRAWGGRAVEDRGQATRVLESLGFEFTWYSDMYMGAAARAGSWASVNQWDGHGMCVRVNTPDAQVLEEVGAIVERELGLSAANVYYIPEAE